MGLCPVVAADQAGQDACIGSDVHHRMRVSSQCASAGQG